MPIERLAEAVRDIRNAALLWATVAVLSGFGQLFRSDMEKLLGIGYIFAGLVLASSRLTLNANHVSIGFCLVSGAFAARSVSGWFIPNAPWHSSIIISPAWGAMALINATLMIQAARNEG